MQFITEPSRSYSDLDSLRHDTALADVRETRAFRLEQMRLSPNGVIDVKDVGEFPLSEIALRDALKRGGMYPACCQNFFDEGKPELDEVVVNVVNAFYKHSRYSASEVKLVTRADASGERIALGIPSRHYSLFTHNDAINKIVDNISPDLRLKRANLYPEFMELGFTDPINTVKDKVGEVVEIGAAFYNSQGTRTCSLLVCAFSMRLVCLNGATANENLFKARYIHRGDMRSQNGRFAEEVKTILGRFSLLMKSLPRLGEIPVTDEFIAQIRPTLKENLKKEEAIAFVEGIDPKTETVGDVWNKVTHLPHRIENPTTKLNLERLGFRILTMFLH